MNYTQKVLWDLLVVFGPIQNDEQEFIFPELCLKFIQEMNKQYFYWKYRLKTYTLKQIYSKAFYVTISHVILIIINP